MAVSVAFVAFGKDIATDIQGKLAAGRKNRKWSPQQESVFDWATQGSGNAFVKAVAGSGKTTTLIETVHRITDGDTSQVKAGTVHSFGYAGWRKVAPKAKLYTNGEKENRIAEEVGIPLKLKGFVFKLVALAKNNAMGLYGNIADKKLWWDIIDHHDMLETLAPPNAQIDQEELEKLAEEGIELAQKALHLSIKLAYEMINFDDMIYMPVVTACKLQQYDWVVVDEAQDINPARRALIRKLMKPE